MSAPTTATPIVWWESKDVTGKVNNDQVDYTSILDSSGNGNHATGNAVAGSGSGQGGVYKTNTINGLASIQFNSNGNGGYNFASKLPAGRGSQTFMIAKAQNIAAGNSIFHDSSGTLNFSAAGLNPVMFDGGVVATSVSGITADTWYLFEMRVMDLAVSDPGHQKVLDLFRNGVHVASYFTGSAASQNLTMGNWMTSALGLNGNAALFGAYSPTDGNNISVADVNRIHSYVSSTYGISLPSAFTGSCVLVGDSITGNHLSESSWATLLQRHAAEDRFRCINLGLGGQTSAQLATNIAAQLTGLVDAAVTRNALIIGIGSNDVAAGTAAATTYTNIQTVVAAGVSAGFTKIIVVTVLPRGTNEAIRTTLNSSITGGAAGGGYTVADVASDANMGAAGKNSDTTYYNADAVHPNTTGHALMYNSYIGPAFDALSWPSTSPTGGASGLVRPLAVSSLVSSSLVRGLV